MPTGRGPRRSDFASEYARTAGLGLQFALTVGLLAWGGWWLDGRLSTTPLFLILGVLAGFAGSTISLVRSAASRRGPAAPPPTDDSTR